MLLHEALTHIHSQIKPRLFFGASLTLRVSDSFDCSYDGERGQKKFKSQNHPKRLYESCPTSSPN